MENNNIEKQPKVEQPKVEQPKTEQPAAQQPKTEQPKPQRDWAKEWNEKMSRHSHLVDSVGKARKQGLDPQSVFDSVAKENNIGDGHEDYDYLKGEAFRDAKQGPDGKYQYRKYNVGSNKLLSGDERAKMEKLAQKLNDAGYKARLVDGWQDYGAGMQWSNILGNSPTLDMEYWALNPKQWLDYMNDDVSDDDIVEQLRQRDPDSFVTSRSKNKELNNLYGLDDNPEQDIDITDEEVDELAAPDEGGSIEDLYNKIFG